MSTTPMSERKVRVPPPKRPAAGTPGRGTGRDAFSPTEQQRAMVKTLALAGFTQVDICKAIRNPETHQPISKPTLELHFREELDLAFFESAALTVQNFMRKCTGAPAQYDQKTGKVLRKEVESETKAQTFFLNTRLKNMGWSSRLEHTGKDGAPLPASLAGMSDEQLDEFVDRLEARIDAAGGPVREAPAPKKAKGRRKPRG